MGSTSVLDKLETKVVRGRFKIGLLKSIHP